MSLTSGLDVARSSLGAISEQISIVSRNVSRVGDPDATRKSAQVITDMGATVRVARIDRSFEAGLLDKYLSSNATSQTHTALANALDKLQQTIGDTDVLTSPSALIGKLNAALQEYSSSPSNPSFAAAVVSTAKDLANSLNTASQTVASVRREADADIAAAVGNVNTLLAQVAIVNKEIVNGTRAGVDVTDALDKRDGLLKALSGEIGIRVVSRDDNDIAIYTESGVTMFDVVPRSVTFAPTISLASGATGSSVYVDGVPVLGMPQMMGVSTGRMAGLVAVRDQVTVTYEAQIDEIARGLMEAFAEYDQSASPTLPAVAGLFTYSGGPGLPPTGTIVNGLAGLITVNANVDPSQGGDLSRLRDGGISNPGNPAYVYNLGGEASYGDRIQDLIDKMSLDRSFDPGAGAGVSMSIASYANASVSWLEGSRQTAHANANYSNTIMERASTALSKETGISLDEEMARMLELERTYQASSRLITAIDSMLESLLSSVR